MHVMAAQSSITTYNKRSVFRFDSLGVCESVHVLVRQQSGNKK